MKTTWKAAVEPMWAMILITMIASGCSVSENSGGSSGPSRDADAMVEDEDESSDDGQKSAKTAGGAHAPKGGMPVGDAHTPAPGSSKGGQGKDDEGTSKQIVDAGIRNYDQINETMSVLTGVPTTTASVRTVYATELATALPTDNDASAFIGSQQVAVFKLAVEYCDALVKDPARRSLVFGSFDFASAPSRALDATGKAQLADALISRFWGKNLSSLPEHAASVAMVNKLIDELLTGKNLATVSLTTAVATSACVATLASAPVTLY